MRAACFAIMISCRNSSLSRGRVMDRQLFYKAQKAI